MAAFVEIAARGDVEVGAKERAVVGAQQRQHFFRCPDEEFTLNPLTVRVLGAVEAAFGRGQLAQHVVQRLLNNLPQLRLAGDLPGVEIGARQLRVVVEHLLEVRHEPVGVGAVAVEAAAELVVDPAAGHLGQGVGDGLPLLLIAGAPPILEQEVQVHRLRELRRIAEPTLMWVEAAHQVLSGLVQYPGRQRGIRGSQGCAALERVRQPVAGRFHLAAALLPGFSNRPQHLPEAGHAVARLRRIVGAAVERPAVGGQEDGHRPTAAAGQRLDGLHVDGVDVGPFLAIYLDVDEQFVHQRRGVGIFERLMRHHVAPVARRIAHAEQDRPVFGRSACQRLRPPGIPIHRVARVLQQVRAGFVAQAVRHIHTPIVGDKKHLSTRYINVLLTRVELWLIPLAYRRLEG